MKQGGTTEIFSSLTIMILLRAFFIISRKASIKGSKVYDIRQFKTSSSEYRCKTSAY